MDLNWKVRNLPEWSFLEDHLIKRPLLVSPLSGLLKQE